MVFLGLAMPDHLSLLGPVQVDQERIVQMYDYLCSPPPERRSKPRLVASPTLTLLSGFISWHVQH